jgi:ABC-type molybdate transport system ATPase subunit
LQVGSARLLAEVTQDAISNLGIVEGKPLYALIKSVSLQVRSTV